MSLTKRLVSVARMPFAHVLPNSFFDVRRSLRFPIFGRKKRVVNIGGTELASSSNDDLVSLLIPLQNRAGSNPKLLANLCRYGDLPLRRKPGLSDCHTFHITL